jgi:antitoxin component YwqK of YwqJK toxin-antitoxin module
MYWKNDRIDRIMAPYMKDPSEGSTEMIRRVMFHKDVDSLVIEKAANNFGNVLPHVFYSELHHWFHYQNEKFMSSIKKLSAPIICVQNGDNVITTDINRKYNPYYKGYQLNDLKHFFIVSHPELVNPVIDTAINDILTMFLVFIQGQAQENEPKVRLGFMTPNFLNPGYVNGKLKEMTQISFEAELINGKVEKGKKLNNSEHLFNHALRQATFQFNEAGEMIKVILYDDKENNQWLAICDNENGHVKKITILVNDSISHYLRFFYDVVGLKEIQTRDPMTDKILGKSTFQCDNHGNIIKRISWNEFGEKIGEVDIIREELGRIHVMTYKNKDGLITNRTEYSYGSDFEPLFIDTKISNGEAVDINERKEHFYDDKGNWIKQIRFINDKPINITERTYVYYQHPL